jgi:hypothetical protein
MVNGVVNGGKKGKSQGIGGSANANDVWVWMRPHIGFCTIGNCDLLSFFFFDRISLISLQISSSFFKTWSFSTEVSPVLLFNTCSSLSLSFEDPSFLGRDKGLIWSLRNA